MAKRNLKQNIDRAVEDFKNIKSTLIDIGVEILDGTPTSQYADKIRERATSRNSYSGTFTLTEEQEAERKITITDLPFEAKRVYIWSYDVTDDGVFNLTSDYGDNKFCVMVDIDTTIPFCIAICRYWRTDFSTPKAGYTRAPRANSNMLTTTPNSISIDAEEIYKNSKIYFKSGCKYYYTITG